MRPAHDPAGHRVPRTKPTCLIHAWRPHRQRSFTLVHHLHQHQSSRNLHLQYLAKNQSTQRCQSLITQGNDHPPVLEPHMVLRMVPNTTVEAIRRSDGARIVELGGSLVITLPFFQRTAVGGSSPPTPPATSARNKQHWWRAKDLWVGLIWIL
jgi:hypothetical protein